MWKYLCPAYWHLLRPIDISEYKGKKGIIFVSIIYHKINSGTADYCKGNTAGNTKESDTFHFSFDNALIFY